MVTSGAEDDGQQSLSSEEFADLVRRVGPPIFRDASIGGATPLVEAGCEVDLHLLALRLEMVLDISLPTALIDSLCTLDDLNAYCALAVERRKR